MAGLPVDSAVEALAALRLMAEWGADEALGDAPVRRLQDPPAGRLHELKAAQQAVVVARAVDPPQASLSNLQSIAALYDAWAAFDGCALRATATTIVRASGTAGAGVLLLGDAPTADDDRSGQAFSGTPGVAIDRVLSSIGLDRSLVMFAHLVPWRPPGNRPPSDTEIRSCLPYIQQLLRLCGTTHAVLLGQATARILLGTEDRLSRLRGRWQDLSLPGASHPVSAMVMAPAEAWLRTANSRRETWADLLLLRTTLDQLP